MTDLRLIYVTAKDKSQALAIGKELVESKVAACVNILEGMTSLYTWKGRLEQASEVVLIVKTEERLVAEVIATVKREHSYEVPCALVLPVLGGSSDYITWLSDSLKA
jgi:periplasmic divalent cation tolerance protein